GHHGYPDLHGPGTGLGMEAPSRPPLRSLLAWRDALHPADRPAAHPGDDADGDDRAGPDARAGPALAAPAEGPARPRDDLLEVPAEGAGEALRDRRGPGR